MDDEKRDNIAAYGRLLRCLRGARAADHRAQHGLFPARRHRQHGQPGSQVAELPMQKGRRAARGKGKRGSASTTATAKFTPPPPPDAFGKASPSPAADGEVRSS